MIPTTPRCLTVIKPTSPILDPSSSMPSWPQSTSPPMWRPMLPTTTGTSMRRSLDLQGIAAISLNTHGREVVPRDPEGTPYCSAGLRMTPTYQFEHTNGFRVKPLSLPTALPWADWRGLWPCPIGPWQRLCQRSQLGERRLDARLVGQEQSTLSRRLHESALAVNASTARPRHSALNTPKCAMVTPFALSILGPISLSMYVLYK